MDKYDEEIAYLTANPHMIQNHWADSTPLFDFLHDNGICDRRYGCPTMIKKGTCVAQYPHLTKMVMKSDIPSDDADLEIHHLSALAEIQREADKVLKRRGH